MKQIIFKYPFEIKDRLDLKLPVGSTILFIEKQRQLKNPQYPDDGWNEWPMMWVQIDPDEKRTEIRTFEIVGTGHEFNSKGKHYIGSLMMNEDIFVWHCYEIVVPGAR